MKETWMHRKAVPLFLVLLLAVFAVSCGEKLFYQFSSQRVVEVFQTNGLEAADPRPATEADYGGAPMVAKDAMYFSIPSLGAGEGGLVMAFESEENLAKAKAYFDEQAKSQATPARMLVRDNILVIMSGKLSEAEGNQYEGVLAKLKYIRG